MLTTLWKCIILAYFSKTFNKPRVNFLRVWTKKTIIWKFWQIFEIFRNFTSENCKQCIILAYFSNMLTNYAFIFCAFGRKTQIVGKFSENFEIFWSKFYRKIEFFNFFYFFENLLLKIELSEITPNFYNNFFRFWGVGEFSPPPGFALGVGGLRCSSSDPEKFSEFLKKEMKTLQVFDNLDGKFAICHNCLNSLSNISRKFEQKFRKIWEYTFVWGWGKLANLLES